MTDPVAGTVASPQNPRVVAARKLRLGKERRAQGAFLVEGARGCAEALRSGWHVRELFLTPEHTSLARTAEDVGVPVTTIADRVARSLADTVHPQGAFAVVDLPAYDLDAILSTGPRLAVVLAGVADPGNAGTVIRTAAAAGADLVVIPTGGVDPYSGKCVRASAGGFFHVPVVTGMSAPSSVDRLRGAGLQVLAADLDGDDLYAGEDELRRPTAWLFGNEAHGLDPAASAVADRRIRIPMAAEVESLNLAAAAAVCLFATARVQSRS